MYDRKYVLELENLVMDELIPMYIIGCRSVGRKPLVHSILDKLMKARGERREMPWILKNLPK